MAGLFFRLIAAFRYRVNSDEPQHLHVVWEWTQGLLAYRDFFDNHMPLFQLLSVPALWAVGERPAAVLWMRVLTTTPVWLGIAWLSGRIGRALFSARVGLWSAVLAALWPIFFLCSLEFRPDGLWTLLWLGAVVVLVEGRVTAARGFVAGALLGLAAGVSMKTTLLLGVLAVAGLATLVIARDHRPPWRALVRSALAALVGLALVPVAIAGFFADRGAWQAYAYDVVWHNVLPALAQPTRVSHWWVLVVTPLLGMAAAGARRTAPTPALGARRAFVLLAAGLHLTMLYAAWPLVTRQSLLPALPLIAVFTAAAAADVRVGARWRRWGGIPAIVGVLALVRLLTNHSVAADRANEMVRFESDVLRLTTPVTPVFDQKGEAVFRPRPTYWVLETITRERLRRGLIADDFADRLRSTGTPVVAADDTILPGATRRFLHAHYLRVQTYRRIDSLWVLGDRLDRPAFELPIGATYALVAPHGQPHGTLDGTPYDGPRLLAAGPHAYDPAPGDERVALLWAPAAAQGFSPFTSQARWR